MQSKEAMQDFVIDLLKKNIPANYTYHNYEHTLYVQQKVKELAVHEQLDKHDTDLLNTAALWHDIGYIHLYKGHEEESCAMAREYLPGYSYNDDDINRICGMIMATKVPQQPQNFLEQLIADADLAYLGSIGAFEKADDLYKEISSVNKDLSKNEWNEQQVSFLTSHRYFTKFYQDKKEMVKRAYLEEVKREMR